MTNINKNASSLWKQFIAGGLATAFFVAGGVSAVQPDPLNMPTDFVKVGDTIGIEHTNKFIQSLRILDERVKNFKNTFVSRESAGRNKVTVGSDMVVPPGYDIALDGQVRITGSLDIAGQYRGGTIDVTGGIRSKTAIYVQPTDNQLEGALGMIYNPTENQAELGSARGAMCLGSDYDNARCVIQIDKEGRVGIGNLGAAGNIASNNVLSKYITLRAPNVALTVDPIVTEVELFTPGGNGATYMAPFTGMNLYSNNSTGAIASGLVVHNDGATPISALVFQGGPKSSPKNQGYFYGISSDATGTSAGIGMYSLAAAAIYSAKNGDIHFDSKELQGGSVVIESNKAFYANANEDVTILSNKNIAINTNTADGIFAMNRVPDPLQHPNAWMGINNDLNGIYIGHTNLIRLCVSSQTNLNDGKCTGMMNFDVSGNMTITGTYSPNSDERVKKDIKVLDNALENITKLNGVSYKYRANNKDSMGVIAQNIETVYPELVGQNEEGIKNVNYDGLIAPLIESVKELKSQNDELRARIEVLENR
jgi:hypothetical protein